MKTLKLYFIILLSFLSVGVYAQHFIAGSVQGGYSGVFDKMEQTKLKGLMGAQFGVSYNWQYDHLLLNVGAEFSYYKHRWAINDQTITQRMRDTEDMTFIYNGLVTKRTDDFSSSSLRFPVLAGAEFGKFYFMLGAIPDIHFNGTAHATGVLTTTGVYDEFYIPLVDMENHGFYTRALSNSQKMRYKFDVLGHAELGVSLGEKHKYRLAAFAEIGILDIAPRTDAGKLSDPNYDEYMAVTLNHPYVSTEGMFAKAHNMEFGVKFTAAIHFADNKEKDKDDDEPSEEEKAARDSIARAKHDSIVAVRRAQEEADRLAREAELARQRAFADSVARAQAEQAEYENGNTSKPYRPFGPNTNLKKEQLSPGSQYTLQELYFDTDKTIVMITSLPTLKQLYRLLVDNPDMKIKIIGHTDSQGSALYNMYLSYRRAQSVRNTLVRWGIDSSRMKIEGHGEEDPVVPNTTPEGRQLNRRVVFEVM